MLFFFVLSLVSLHRSCPKRLVLELQYALKNERTNERLLSATPYSELWTKKKHTGSKLKPCGWLVFYRPLSTIIRLFSASECTNTYIQWSCRACSPSEHTTESTFHVVLLIAFKAGLVYVWCGSFCCCYVLLVPLLVVVELLVVVVLIVVLMCFFCHFDGGNIIDINCFYAYYYYYYGYYDI